MQNLTPLYSQELILNLMIVDIDECASDETNNCDENADCTNIDGSFTCACKPGWGGDGRTCSGM